MTNLSEAKDLSLYKKLIILFSDFVNEHPGTGMGKIYRELLTAGLKSIPKNEKAIEILNFVISSGGPRAVQELMNTTFSELPITIRPCYKIGNSKLVAFWSKNDKLYTKVFELLNMNTDTAGKWADEKSQPVTLIDLNILKEA